MLPGPEHRLKRLQLPLRDVSFLLLLFKKISGWTIKVRILFSPTLNVKPELYAVIKFPDAIFGESRGN
jgi:hypothetical protein